MTDDTDYVDIDTEQQSGEEYDMCDTNEDLSPADTESESVELARGMQALVGMFGMLGTDGPDWRTICLSDERLAAARKVSTRVEEIIESTTPTYIAMINSLAAAPEVETPAYTRAMSLIQYPDLSERVIGDPTFRKDVVDAALALYEEEIGPKADDFTRMNACEALLDAHRTWVVALEWADKARGVRRALESNDVDIVVRQLQDGSYDGVGTGQITALATASPDIAMRQVTSDRADARPRVSKARLTATLAQYITGRQQRQSVEPDSGDWQQDQSEWLRQLADPDWNHRHTPRDHDSSMVGSMSDHSRAQALKFEVSRQYRSTGTDEGVRRAQRDGEITSAHVFAEYGRSYKTRKAFTKVLDACTFRNCPHALCTHQTCERVIRPCLQGDESEAGKAEYEKIKRLLGYGALINKFGGAGGASNEATDAWATAIEIKDKATENMVSVTMSAGDLAGLLKQRMLGNGRG